MASVKSKNSNNNDSVRVLVAGDTHCGSITGLTPLALEEKPEKDNPKYEAYELRQWLWANFTHALDERGPFDIAVWNGDLIDGSQKRNGGYELLVRDQHEQAEIAKSVVRRVKAPLNYFVEGTSYHTGNEEDFEAQIANDFDEELRRELVLEVRGTWMHFFHHASGGRLAHTRNNSLGREIVNMKLRLQEERIDAETMHLLFRSHVHFGGHLGDRGMQAWRVPALQLENGSKYARKFEPGGMEYGFLFVDIYGPGIFSVHEVMWPLPPKMAVRVEGSFDKAAAELRKDAIEIAKNAATSRAVIPQGYVGGEK